VVVRGFDFRPSEPIYAGLGAAIVVGVSVLYFHL
jgi:hypothetical protein